jgi:hypothetical protein
MPFLSRRRRRGPMHLQRQRQRPCQDLRRRAPAGRHSGWQGLHRSMQRAYETAMIAGSRDAYKMADLTAGGLVVRPEETAACRCLPQAGWPRTGAGP